MLVHRAFSITDKTLQVEITVKGVTKINEYFPKELGSLVDSMDLRILHKLSEASLHSFLRDRLMREVSEVVREYSEPYDHLFSAVTKFIEDHVDWSENVEATKQTLQTLKVINQI